jgi:hypothetical protein
MRGQRVMESISRFITQSKVNDIPTLIAVPEHRFAA